MKAYMSKMITPLKCLVAALLIAGSGGCEDPPTAPTGDVDVTLAAYKSLESLTVEGWCGPAALAWIYCGLYTHYQGVPLKTSLLVLRDYVRENYAHPIQWQQRTNFYMTIDDVRAAVTDITDGEYACVDLDSHDWAAAHNWINPHRSHFLAGTPDEVSASA